MQEITSKRILGKRLKSLRVQEQLSQEELAKILEISRSNYSQIELGKQYPTYQSLNLLCKYFEKDYNWILNPNDTEVKSLVKVSLQEMIPGQQHNVFPFIDLVSANAQKKYINKYNDSTFIEKLPKISFPINDSETELRAFEVGKNLPNLNLKKGDIVIGSKVAQLQNINLNYLYIIHNTEKLQFSRCAYNLANAQLLLIDKFKNEQLNQSEVIELWQVTSKYSSNFAVEEQQLELQTEKFEHILNDLRNEIIQLIALHPKKNGVHQT
ncbi:helix-turn-helix domain-containing protein [Pedobacter arcticus]|uniref:helix-turn-helix domain-containing protein n=1 Tax=Pedobacter arcticus TaxID=752140 RepID=UPI0002D4C29D|nr:helix-turn-helix transcriptional regulator [Pedobacter arcticus]